ncbi:MAG: hypothetical protein RLP44_29220 [Aggregatilineales bacterium]
MNITIARFAPMIRFFVSWMLFLGGMTLAFTNFYLQSERIDLYWYSLSNDESLLVHVNYRQAERSESFIARTDDYANHYQLGDNLNYLLISPDRDRVFFIDQNRIHLADVPTSQIHALMINGNTQVNLCRTPVWSPDSEWVAVVILDNDHLECTHRNAVGVDKHVILINRDGQTTRNLYSFTEDWSGYLLLWSEDSQYVYVETDERFVVSTLDGRVRNVDSTLTAELNLTPPERERPQWDLPTGLDVSVFVDTGSVTNIIVGVLAVMLALVLTFWWEKVEIAYRRAFPST